jgi:UDP-N-acetyl-D-glucosamine dehydrogenase
MTSEKAVLINSLRDHSATIGILGLGYVGLPLTAAFGEAGFKIFGIDPDQRKVNSINIGKSYVQDVSDNQI